MDLSIAAAAGVRPHLSPFAQAPTVTKTAIPPTTARDAAPPAAPVTIAGTPPDQAAAIAQTRLSPDGGGTDPTVRVLKPYGVPMLPRGPAMPADPPT